MRSTVVFVCQHGELEFKAVLLAASLRQHLVGGGDLVACIPEPAETWGEPSAATFEALAALGVRTERITNPIGGDYAIGNKVAAVAVPTDADRVVFLDSDILCLRELDLDRCFAGDFRARPADLATFAGTIATWARLYGMFGLPEPGRRVVTTVSGEVTPPYFNAGVVAFRTGAGFPEAWADCCRVIDRDPEVPDRRPHLDQIALPIAAARCGLSFSSLPGWLNYPAHLLPLSTTLPVLCHYHWPDVLRREPALVQAVADLLERHPRIGPVLEASACRDILVPAVRRLPPRPKRAPPAASPPDGLVTGIPRSGTSFLCSCLHRLRDQVAVNEPAEVFARLQQRLPWGIPLLYAEMRARILAGEPIENKLHGDRVAEDTAIQDIRSAYRPNVGRDDFGLWTKNTLAYMARLAQLRTVMPWAPIVACVRHPLDTIGSWIRTFPHLRDAAVEDSAVGSPTDAWLAPEARERLVAVAGCKRPALRRALLWRHLATTVLEHRRAVSIVRYEDLVSDPAAVLVDLVARLSGGPAADGLDALRCSTPSRSRDCLEDTDREAIADVCGDVARQLGYEM